MPTDEGEPYQEEEAQRCIHATTNQNEDESNDINNSGDEGGDEDEDETKETCSETQPSHDNEVQETQETCSETQPSNTQGRGKAKGGKGKGMLIEIYKGRPIFQKYKSTGQRYANRPENVPDPSIWIAMVDEWLKPEWQDQSKRNKSNREKSTIVHTTGSVPMAKYQKDELDRTGIEPSPIDCFKKFHISKGKNGEGENWPSEKAKELYEKMENKKAAVEQENLDVNDWDIYREVIAPSHGSVLGLGGGVKAKDAYYSSTNQNCNKRRCVELEENHEHLKEELNDVKGQLSTLQQRVQMLINNNPQNSAHSARQSPNADNVGSCSDAYLS
ncbi:unnamed protein product [Prunus armeniaca]